VEVVIDCRVLDCDLAPYHLHKYQIASWLLPHLSSKTCTTSGCVQYAHASWDSSHCQQKVATERPCYICRRPTQVVLATIKTEDFLYTCIGHLTDPYVRAERHVAYR
jgi:hypothetical protein